MAKKTSYVPGTPSWADLMAADLGGAKRFYGELLGWTFQGSPTEFGGYTQAYLAGERVVGLFPRPPEMPAVPPAWTTYFDTTDADASIDRVRGAGGTVVAPPMDVGDFGRMALAMDPTGATFGLWQARSHTGAGLFGDVGTMCWHELNTRALPAASAFYAAVLGTSIEPMEPGDSYLVIRAEAHTHGGLMTMAADVPAEVPAHWLIYFAVADTDAAAAKVSALGGQVHTAPFDTPQGRIAIVADREGAAFGIISMPPA